MAGRCNALTVRFPLPFGHPYPIVLLWPGRVPALPPATRPSSIAPQSRSACWAEQGASPTMILIQIGDFEFELREAYTSGHALTPAEAQALNGLRAERIREKIARDLDRLVELDGEGLAAIRQKARDLDKDWEFTLQLHPRKRQSTELAEIIGELARVASRRAYGDERGERELSNSPSILQEARLVLLARREAAKAMLEEL